MATTCWYLGKWQDATATTKKSEGKLEELDLSDVALADGGSPYYSTTRGNYYTATSNDVDDNEENFYCTDLSYAFANTHLKRYYGPTQCGRSEMQH